MTLSLFRLFSCFYIYFSFFSPSLHFLSSPDDPKILFSYDFFSSIHLSGFTTSLQLRETPTFVKVINPSSISAKESEQDAEKYGLSDFHELESGNKSVTYVLQRRQQLNIRSFMLSRLVGLMPILWLGLLLNIPPWMSDLNSQQPITTQVQDSHFFS